jgi:hypothetical protein
MVAAAPPLNPSPTAKPLSEGEKIELMRLRREAGELTRRRRDLMAVTNEHSRLKGQIDAARTNGRPALPPGYLLAAEAKFSGQTTPESALQSFFWAMRQGDQNALKQIMTEESAANFVAEMQKGGEEGFNKMRRMLAGFRVVERKEEGDDAELKVEIAPGVDPIPLRFRKVGDAWRLAME